MSYRDTSEQAYVLWEEHEVAKATLEELADQEIHFNGSDNNEKLYPLHYALINLRFERVGLYHDTAPMAYVRKVDGRAEILTDRNLTDYEDKHMHLYSIPAERSTQEWCQRVSKISRKELIAKGPYALRYIAQNSYFMLQQSAKLKAIEQRLRK